MAVFKVGSGFKNHGRYTLYQMGCRCDECREAWRVYSKDLRARRKTGDLRKPGRPKGTGAEHGSMRGMWMSCSCDLCKAYRNGYQAGRKSRIQGLPGS